MLDTPRQMYRNVITTTLGNVATVPSGVVWVVRNIIVTNITATAATATLYFNNIGVIVASPIPANGVLTLDIAQVITAGQSIQASASANSTVALQIAGIEVAV